MDQFLQFSVGVLAVGTSGGLVTETATDQFLQFSVGVLAMLIPLSLVAWALVIRWQKGLRAKLAEMVIEKGQLTTEYADEMAKKLDEIAALTVQLAHEKSLVEQYRGNLEGFQNEKDKWRTLYHQQSESNGTTICHLMEERERNHRMMVSNKLRPYIDPTIGRLVNAYKEDHYEPARLARLSEKLPDYRSDPDTKEG